MDKSHGSANPRAKRVPWKDFLADVVVFFCSRVSGMNYGLKSRDSTAIDFICFDALVHRLDPGVAPFSKAIQYRVHVSGGEFNLAANLSDCFGLRSGIVTAMVKYQIGDMVAERVRAMGVKPFYKFFEHNGVNGPNIATVYSDHRHGVRGPVVF